MTVTCACRLSFNRRIAFKLHFSQILSQLKSKTEGASFREDKTMEDFVLIAGIQERIFANMDSRLWVEDVTIFSKYS